MRFLGVRVDVEKTYDTSKDMMNKESKLLADIKKKTGKSFNPWSSQEIAKMFDHLHTLSHGEE